jgi:hypothetical protein
MRNLYGLFAVLLLSGCGGGREDKAVDACSAELTEKLTGKTFVLDKADMRAQAKPEGDDAVMIQSSVTFDAGLPSESKQTYECKARITGNNASVISLTFSW